MAEVRTEFVYRGIELYKSQSLGSGSYGGVCKAKCDGLPCAAKIMHPTLFDLRDPGAPSFLRKFREECRLLSLARHPNVVQYLGTHTDPDTQLPVLLMEVCEESLTAFLERSPRPLSYHIQVNICHDIALALVYLHSNGLIHRDLTGNNILMMAGPRAKITDFGMSKLFSTDLRMTSLTLCPGNRLYMSPEALDEAKSYTAKLDTFSFGVIVIQILTRQFPDPIDRFRMVYVAEFDESLRREVPEMERRKDHLNQISGTHPLKPLAIQCLLKESARPSSLQLSGRLSDLKQSSMYTESTEHQVQTNGTNGDLEQLEAQFRETSMRESEDYQSRIAELERIIVDKDRVIQEQRLTIQAKERLLEEVREHQNSVKKTFDITRMTWREGESAPEAMCRGAVVVHENTAYFRPAGSRRVYSYRDIAGEEQWSRYPDNYYSNFGLAVIDGLVTSVGGERNEPQNILLTFKAVSGQMVWCEVFPPMPTPRCSAACVSFENALVVAGGCAAGDYLSTVEVMNTDTKQWATVSPLPQKAWLYSTAISGDTLYLGGGADSIPLKSVFSCSLRQLLSPVLSLGSGRRQTLTKTTVWKPISALPITGSTLASYGNNLLAVGGRDEYGNPTSNVYVFDSDDECWRVVANTKSRQALCFAVSFPDCLTIVGGVADCSKINSVEIFK